MAVVYEAEQRVLARKVAVKSAGKRGGRGDGVLLNEARVTGALEHPGILPVHDILVDADGHPHIVMKRIDGAAWGDLLRDSETVADRFGRSDLLGWNLDVLVAVCHAMEFAHSLAIIHRDLKPNNVMVADYGQVYVLDWGVAVSLDTGEHRFPRAADADRLMGTPRYMAPEMVSRPGLKNLSIRTDVYLLGAILYEIVAGRPPHRGFDLKTILASPLTFVPELPDAPVELQAILRRAMAIDPAERFADVRGFREAIEGFQSHRGAVRLAERTQESLERLLPLLDDADAERIEVYDLFGQVRFGFLEALRGWPENDAAREGLEQAVERMAEWELDQGDDRAAEILLSQLQEVPGGLSRRLDDLRQEREGERQLLLRLAKRADPRVGRELRLLLMGVLGVLWSVGPWAATQGPWVDAIVTVSTASIVFTIVAVGWRRLTATRRSRIFAAVLSSTLVGNLVLTAGVLTDVFSREELLRAVWPFYGSMVLVLGLLLEPLLLVPAAAFFGCFLALDWLWPVRTAVATGLNLLVAVSGFYVFWRRY